MKRSRPLFYRKLSYPWTPTKKDKTTLVQSFAAYRSGVLPILELNSEGEPEFTLVDVRTKDGLAQYDRAVKRGTQS